MPADLAALSALRKFLHAIITFHWPVSAKALAVAKPKPEEAPVIITLPFLRVFFASGAASSIAGVVVAVWALMVPIGSWSSLLLSSCRQWFQLIIWSIYFEVLGFWKYQLQWSLVIRVPFFLAPFDYLFVAVSLIHIYRSSLLCFVLANSEVVQLFISSPFKDYLIRGQGT